MQVILKTLAADGQAQLTPIKTLSNATLSDLWYDIRMTTEIQPDGKSLICKSVQMKNNLPLSEYGVAELDIIELVDDTPSSTKGPSSPAAQAASTPTASQVSSTPQSPRRLVDVLAEATF
jgi:hypothetical protein